MVAAVNSRPRNPRGTPYVEQLIRYLDRLGGRDLPGNPVYTLLPLMSHDQVDELEAGGLIEPAEYYAGLSFWCLSAARRRRSA